MAQLKVGLAPNRTSYYDKLTNTYITLQAPVQTITYDESNVAGTVARLDRITHALLASIPALTLYDGQLPQESIDAWKAKYSKPFSGPTTRNIVSGGKVIGSVPITDPLRNGIDFVGREIEPNRAFDRADKAEASAVTGLSSEEATIVDVDKVNKEEEAAPETTQETQEVTPANTRQQKRQTANTTKTDK